MDFPTWENLFDAGNPGSYLAAAAIMQGLYPGWGPLDPILERDPIVQELRRFTGPQQPLG